MASLTHWEIYRADGSTSTFWRAGVVATEGVAADGVADAIRRVSEIGSEGGFSWGDGDRPDHIRAGECWLDQEPIGLSEPMIAVRGGKGGEALIFNASKTGVGLRMILMEPRV